MTLLAATLVAQTAYELFADPALVEAAWAEFRGDGLTGRRATGERTGLAAGATIADGAPRWTLDANRRRPQRRNDPTGRLRRRRPRLPEDPMSERHDPHGPDRLRRA